MAYRKLNIDGFGEVDFCGNAGVMAQIEDELNISFIEKAQSGSISVSLMYCVLYWSHYVASKRLKKAIIMDREDIKFWITGKKLTEIIPLLIGDIVGDFGDAVKDEEKKT